MEPLARPTTVVMDWRSLSWGIMLARTGCRALSVGFQEIAIRVQIPLVTRQVYVWICRSSCAPAPGTFGARCAGQVAGCLPSHLHVCRGNAYSTYIQPPVTESVRALASDLWGDDRVIAPNVPTCKLLPHEATQHHFLRGLGRTTNADQAA